MWDEEGKKLPIKGQFSLKSVLAKILLELSGSYSG